MAFTYDPTLDTDLDVVRFLVQDTVSATAELANEEITYLLTTYGSPEGAALAAARSLYAKYAKQVSKAVGDLRISYSDRAKAWSDLLGQLETQAIATNPLEIYVGGVERADAEDDAEDVDLEPGRFAVGFHDFLPTPADELRRED